jgi:NAD+ kinase
MNPAFRRIGIIGKLGDTGIAAPLGELYALLQERGYELCVDEQSAVLLDIPDLRCAPLERLPQHCELLIAMGGDGTFLTASRVAAEYGIPLLGINLGRLGFLVDISPDQLLSHLLPMLQGKYLQQQRCLLQMAVVRDHSVIAEQTAVNEVVVHRWVTPSVIEIVTHIDGVYLNTQRSDGLIVATPTGSTAYSLSAGGPILHPNLNALVLVPLNPHALSNRPIVIQDSARIEISFSLSKQIAALVTCDHLQLPDVRTTDHIVITKSNKTVKILQPQDHDFFHILRSKLNWSGG